MTTPKEFDFTIRVTVWVDGDLSAAVGTVVGGPANGLDVVSEDFTTPAEAFANMLYRMKAKLAADPDKLWVERR
jgi:hypothetical protein